MPLQTQELYYLYQKLQWCSSGTLGQVAFVQLALNFIMCVCVYFWCLGHTVLDGVLEKHQTHWHQSRTLVIVLQLCLHVSLEVGQITQVFVHPELIQEITCQLIKTINT